MELPPHWREWGLDVELADDVSAAEWLDDALRPWMWPGGDGPVWVASFVPDGYEAFARIPHPDGEDRQAEQIAALGAILAPHTETPESCVFCFWVGSGPWGEPPRNVPRVRLPHREHFLFTGPIARTARPFTLDGWEQSPSMWWPADRTWFVATEVDACSTYVGGSRPAIDAVIASPALGASRATADQPLA